MGSIFEEVLNAVLNYFGLGNKMTTKEAGTKAKTAETSKKASASSAKGAPLTEAELLKMSDKDYMSAAQLEFFRTKLQTLKEDILKHASETTEHLRENILVPDPADRATIEEEHALELRTRDRERKLLKKVEQALARIEWCEETGEPIGVSRLIARPTANLSLEAQERRELRQKLFGE
jgi:DnaK suppressor protein